MKKPPGLARWVLRRSLPIETRDGLIGDLDEEYRRHVRPGSGAVRSRWWYWRQALASLPWLVGRDVARDVRFGIRSLAQQPGFTVAAVVTLALGIGANTAIFSIVNAVLLRPLPYAEAERLVHIFEFDAVESARRDASWPEYVDWRALNQSFDEIAAYDGGSRTLTGVDGAERVPVAQVTGNFFRTLGVNPHLGRTFEDGEDGSDPARLVVLTYETWQSRFGADGSIVGEVVALNGFPYTIVGVLPVDFEFSLRGTAELYLPLFVSQAQEERRYQHWLDLIGRVREGVTLEQAEADLSRLASATAAEVGDWHAGVSEIVVPLRDEMVAGIRPALLVLLAAVGVVLLVTCANVAGLLLARSATRGRELGIRAALGAGRRRLLQQLLTESLLLAVLGGASGLILGSWGLAAMIAAIPEGQRLALPHVRDLSLDATMIGVALGLTVLAGILVGLVPAWRAAGGNVQGVLREGGRSATGRRQGARPVLVGAEVMMAVVLVAGAGVLGKSLVRLLQVTPGFDPNGVLTMRVNPQGGFQTVEQLFAFHRDFLERVASLPGVEGAATINQLPLTGSGNSGSFTVEGEPLVSGETNPEVNIRTVSTDYFRVLGVPLLTGRAIGARDLMNTPPVVLVNQTLAERYFPDRGPLGRKIVFSFFDGQPAWEIVGVVGDERLEGPDQPITPVVYFPYQQTPDMSFSVVARTQVPPLSLIRTVRAEAAAIDPDLPVYNIATMNMIAANSTAVFLRRYVLLLVGGFAALALLLAAVGLYGVMSQSVVERTREIGVRVALGADRAEVIRMILRQGMAPALAGLIAGIAMSLIALRYVGSLLYEVQPHDPFVLTGVAFILGAVALASCWLPARRATHVDPMVSLRAE